MKKFRIDFILDFFFLAVCSKRNWLELQTLPIIGIKVILILTVIGYLRKIYSDEISVRALYLGTIGQIAFLIAFPHSHQLLDSGYFIYASWSTYCAIKYAWLIYAYIYCKKKPELSMERFLQRKTEWVFPIPVLPKIHDK